MTESSRLLDVASDACLLTMRASGLASAQNLVEQDKWRHGAMESPREPPSDMPITAMLLPFIGTWRPGAGGG